MVLVCDQVMCKRGAKSTTEAMGLGFGQRNVGRLFLGRGDPSWCSTLGLALWGCNPVMCKVGGLVVGAKSQIQVPAAWIQQKKSGGSLF